MDFSIDMRYYMLVSTGSMAKIHGESCHLVYFITLVRNIGYSLKLNLDTLLISRLLFLLRVTMIFILSRSTRLGWKFVSYGVEFLTQIFALDIVNWFIQILQYKTPTVHTSDC
uniref:Uncharacterized protein n=1 Tax=Cacopsylla melanoneura TaxID=428564 RepID=A0A8D8ZFC2_9HEMI